MKIKKSSKKQISSSKLPKNDPTCFESFVQEKLKQQGYTLSKEEENLVREAIEKTVAEVWLRTKIQKSYTTICMAYIVSKSEIHA